MEKDSALEANAPSNILNYVSGYKVKLVVKEKIGFFCMILSPMYKRKKSQWKKKQNWYGKKDSYW